MTPAHAANLPPQVAHAPAAFVERTSGSGAAVYESAALGYRVEIGKQGAVLRVGRNHAELRFSGARDATLAAEQRTGAASHRYVGRRSEEHREMYSRVRQKELYPGIDALYYGSQSNLEYDLVVRPFADPAKIRFRFANANVRLNENGSLRIQVGKAEWEQKAPLAFQKIGGLDKQVEAQYVVGPDGEISYALGSYDRAAELTIDPVLAPFGNVSAAGMKNGFYLGIDPSDNIYVGQSNEEEDEDQFQVARVAKFTAAGTLVYQFSVATDNGGDEFLLRALAVAADGTLAFGGITTSKDLPTSASVFQPDKDVRLCTFLPASLGVSCILNMKHADGFVVKLRANGTLQWATYLGAGDRDSVNGLAFGPGGTVYAAGETLSNFFPLKNEFQGCSTLPSNAFLSVLRADGTDLTYSTCLRPSFAISSRMSVAYGVTVDTAGNAYVAGSVKAGNGEFPVRGANGSSPFQPNPAGESDGFVAKFNPSAVGDASLLYSTLVGGNENDALDAIVLDAKGGVCTAGVTSSPNYPHNVPVGTASNPFRGAQDLTVTCVAVNGNGLTFSNTYGVQLQGIANTIVPTRSAERWIARDAQGTLYVTSRESGTFTAIHPFDNAGGAGAGVYLQLSASNRSVTILSHTPEAAGAVVTDSASVPFVGTDAGVRKFDVACAGDVTSVVQVVQGNIIFDVGTGRFRQNISLRTLVGAAMPAGARLVFTQLPAGVTVFQPAGATSCFAPAGAPFVVLPILPPVNAGFVTIAVEFNSSGAGVFYVPKVAGPVNGI
ncbi:MAG: hypothetical protein JST93_26405 [Acidobacteria bacterium]|nr:hypothetical protein [Acidobacteriota bacterium]